MGMPLQVVKTRSFLTAFFYVLTKEFHLITIKTISYTGLNEGGDIVILLIIVKSELTNILIFCILTTYSILLHPDFNGGFARQPIYRAFFCIGQRLLTPLRP